MGNDIEPTEKCPHYDWEKRQVKRTCWLVRRPENSDVPCNYEYECPFDKRTMSEGTPTFYVVFKQHDKKTGLMLETKDQLEAEKTARILNDGLQEKAKALGFRYVVEVEP